MGLGNAIWDWVENLFLDPQDSDSSRTESQPGAEPQSGMDTTSDERTSPGSPVIASDLPAVPLYKIDVNNGDPPLSPVLGPEPKPLTILPSINEDCDVSPQISHFS